jgi:Do/DeqQ family serine protease
MNTKYIKKGGLAAAALAVVTLAAYKAPEAAVNAASSHTAVTATAPSASAPTASAVPVASYAPIVERVMPAVVTIRVEKRASAVPTDGEQQLPEEFRRFFGPGFGQGQGGPRGRGGIQRALGSGVIVSPDGFILTNNHVVDDVKEVQVELPDRRTFTAKVVGTDPASDLAVVKIPAKDLPTLALGDSDNVKVGDVVLAVGNPLGVGETVTSGIISAKGRTTERGNDSYQDFLQTDAPINHGNSGGALVNTSGQLIGINSQILSPSDGNIGLGFAIPSNMAKNVMDQLIETGTVRRAKLGVTVQGISADMATSLGLASSQGALVSNVDPESPAAHAGLKQGDVITQYNGKAVVDSNQLRNEVSGTTPGSTVTLQYVRDGKTETTKATLGELSAKRDRSSSDSEPHRGGKFGMSVEPVTPDLADQAGVPRMTQGVIITELDPDGVAANSGLQEGDVIVKVDGHPVKSVEELRSALDRQDKKPSLLLVARKDGNFFVTLRQQ